MSYQIKYQPGPADPAREKCIAELSARFGPRCSRSESERLLVGKDFWPITGRWLMNGTVPSLPDAVVWPESTEEVSEIIQIANRWAVPVIPFGEGSGVLGSVVAVRGGIVIDMKRMNRILALNEKDLLLTVETGINGAVLERKLNERGYTLRHIPQSVRASTVGGWIACRAAGQFSTKYGKIEDMMVGVEAVLPDGSIYRNVIAPRTAAGPRMDQLFLGAEGTLGVVTQTVLRIWPVPEAQALRSFAFENIENALEAVRLLLQKHINPAVVRIYDAAETDHHFKQIEAAKDRVMLILIMEGIPEMVTAENAVAERVCTELGGLDCGEEPIQHWFHSRFNVSISSHLIQHGAVVDTIEVAAPWSRIAEVYHANIEALKAIPGTLMAGGHFSHVYTDGACLYMSVVGMPEEDQEGYYRKIWDTAINSTSAHGGTIAHHHGIGLNRARFMIDEHGPAGMQMLSSIKKALDPHNLMNPGKLGLEVE